MIRLTKDFVLLFCLVQISWGYEIPDPTVKHNRTGFEVSIPHENGMEYVEFSGRLTPNSGGLGSGIHFHQLTLAYKNRLWTYKNVDVAAKEGDIFSFWFIVRKDGECYRRPYTTIISKIDEEIRPNEPGTFGLAETSEYVIPHPNLKAYRKGLELSIPHEHGIELVYCSAEHKSAFGCPNGGICWHEFVLSYKNGVWAYAIDDIEAKVGDIFRFWFVVGKNHKRYDKFYSSIIATLYDEPTANEPATSGFGQMPQYKIPDLSLKVYRKGFELSMPHDEGIESAYFSIEFIPAVGCSSGFNCWHDFSLSYSNRSWEFRNADVVANVGDIFRIWLIVRRNGQRYDKVHTSTILEIHDENMTNQPGTSGLGQTSQPRLPQTKLRAYRKGFELSIPHEDGMELVTFTADPNVALRYPDGGTGWHPLLCSTLSNENKLWIYKNFDVELKLREVFKFWVSIRKNGIHHLKGHTFLIMRIYERIVTNESEFDFGETFQQYNIQQDF